LRLLNSWTFPFSFLQWLARTQLNSCPPSPQEGNGSNFPNVFFFRNTWWSKKSRNSFFHYIAKKQLYKDTKFRSQTVSWHLFQCGNIFCYNCDQHYKTGRTGVVDADNLAHITSTAFK
jgi:hypothetical protein